MWVQSACISAFRRRQWVYALNHDALSGGVRVRKQQPDGSMSFDVKVWFASASILKDGRVVFNIAGNKYRLVVWINYPYRVVYIRFFGTHEQYDKIDAQNI
ncbi:MAG: type II toxin-antitoxin system HigB family toxin [Gammaproteobacteria bacterium]|jgi:mRNA interferase HigB|nr:type II toxin-antitoxin system HigB family toxin [Gammaproteobacteria bacterium]